MLMRPKHPLDRLLTLKAIGVHHPIASFTAQPAAEMPGDVGMPRRAASHELFIPALPPASFKVRVDVLHRDGMIVII
jgi:hypothetical protein